MTPSGGVAPLCLPWNDQLAAACDQIGANLVVGNTVVCKPGEKTPLATGKLVPLLNEEIPTSALQSPS